EMTQLIFEGVRCFRSYHSCPLKPLTLLVGENSSGKTTFLALARIDWDIIQGNLEEDFFNEEPFLLGSYDHIASLRGGPAGRAKSFLIGLEFPIERNSRKKNGLFSNTVRITARFISQGSQSKLDEWQFECGDFRASMKQPDQLRLGKHVELAITTPKG